MGKQKFFDKKQSATYHILSRDSSDPNYSAPGPAGDRIFVRVDNNQHYNVHGFSDEEPDEEHQNEVVPSKDVFADAAEDDDDDEDYVAEFGFPGSSSNAGGSSLPENVRREIIELGFPDDGYNYLTHLRDIKTSGGGGSFYYENPKAKFEQLPTDVKAYNASRVEIPKVVDNPDETLDTAVAVASTVKARIERVIDDEVAALLDDDSDASRFGSDIEDLEEDFVVRANLPEGPIELELDRLSLREGPEAKVMPTNKSVPPAAQGSVLESTQRPRRMIDDQFEMLQHQEYDSESEDEYGDYYGGEDEPQESLAEKLHHGLKHNIPVDDIMADKYIGPSDLLQEKKGLEDLESPATAAVVIQRTKEYGETYENQSDDEKEVVFVESSDESEAWDCETIVSTYSVLENHPGKIETPGGGRKKKLTEAFPATLSSGNIITLKGKDKLPVDFLPSRKNQAVDKVKDANVPKPETIKRKQHSQESREEKKERKALVKEERREARKTKKEIRSLYQNEVQRAQKFAAVSGPSSIHIL